MRLLVTVLLLLTLSVPLGAEEMIIQPGPEDGVDLWVTSWYTYGSGGGVDDYRLTVGGCHDKYYSLIRFDTATLPERIISARLELYCWGYHGALPTAMNLCLIQYDWSEATNWDDRPGVMWFEALPAPVKNTWYAIDLTVLCQSWVSGEIPNYGIELQPVSTDYNFDAFYSSDANDPALRPRLVIEYENPRFIPPVKPWAPSIPDDPECLFGGNWPTCMTEKNCDKKLAPRPFIHCGFDARAPAGTPVVASGDGVVVIQREDIGGGWGGVVVIEHDTDDDPATTSDRITTLYMHINPTVEADETVVQGRVVGYAAPLATGAHLHFGVRSVVYKVGKGGQGEKEDTFYRGSLPPLGTLKCRSCSKSRTILPAFPERWIDPITIFGWQ